MTTTSAFHRILSLIAAISCCCMAFAWNPATAAENQDHKLLVLFSGNVLGETGPCG